MAIDYEKAYKKDYIIKQYVDKEISEAQKEAERLYKVSGKSSFNMTGGKSGIPNGSSENWQKTIGAHTIWGSASVKVTNGLFNMNITIHEIDKYNFNRGMHDMKTGASDNENGRFEELGWAKSFITRGELVRDVSWSKGKYWNSTVKKPGGGR
jgi:hypothetical protein